jgi:hypothetical protein
MLIQSFAFCITEQRGASHLCIFSFKALICASGAGVARATRTNGMLPNNVIGFGGLEMQNVDSEFCILHFEFYLSDFSPANTC